MNADYLAISIVYLYCSFFCLSQDSVQCAEVKSVEYKKNIVTVVVCSYGYKFKFSYCPWEIEGLKSGMKIFLLKPISLAINEIWNIEPND